MPPTPEPTPSKPWTPFQIVALGFLGLAGVIALIVFLPMIQAMLDTWANANQAPTPNGCGLDPEMENARAIFCTPSQTP
jgi:hypothetical protein